MSNKGSNYQNELQSTDNSNKKQLPFLILSILIEHSNENNPLKKADILRFLESDFNLCCNRKSITPNLNLLMELQNYFQYEIYYDEEKKGYYATNIFTPGELQLLSDSIANFKNIPEKYAREILDKIITVGGSKTYKNNIGYEFSNHKPENSNQQIILNIESISDFIGNDKFITFEINEFEKDKKLYKKQVIENVLPVNMIFNDGIYYLICINENLQYNSYKLNKITNLKEYKENNISYENLETIKKYVKDHPFTVTGEKIQTYMKISQNIIDNIIETFDNDVKITENKELNIYHAELNATKTDIMNWAKINLNEIDIISPQDLRDELRKYSEQVSKKYSTSEDDEYNIALEKITKDLIGKLDFTNINLSHRQYKIIDDLKNKTGKTENDIIYLTLNNNNLITLNFLKDFTKINKITIKNNPIKDFNILSKFKNLNSLYIINTNIENIEFFNDFFNLKILTLKSNKYIQDYSPIYSLKCLEELIISYEEIKKIDMELVRKNNPLIKIKAEPIIQDSFIKISNTNIFDILKTNLDFPYNFFASVTKMSPDSCALLKTLQNDELTKSLENLYKQIDKKDKTIFKLLFEDYLTINAIMKKFKISANNIEKLLNKYTSLAYSYLHSQNRKEFQILTNTNNVKNMNKEYYENLIKINNAIHLFNDMQENLYLAEKSKKEQEKMYNINYFSGATFDERLKINSSNQEQSKKINKFDPEPYIKETLELFLSGENVSTASVQKHFSISFSNAICIMDKLEDLAYISPVIDKTRKLLISQEEFDKKFKK